MEAIAKARFQRYGARKVGQVLGAIRGKTVLQAQELIPLMPRFCAEMVGKTIKSAAANLTIKAGRAGKTLIPADVFIKTCYAGKGPMDQMKRVKPAPMGRAMTMVRKVCHLTVVVSDERRSGEK